MFSDQIPPLHAPPRTAQTFWNLLRAPHAPPHTKFRSTTSQILFTKPTPHLNRSFSQTIEMALGYIDVRSRNPYQYFIDITFDTTYLTYCYGIPFVPFTRVNQILIKKKKMS